MTKRKKSKTKGNKLTSRQLKNVILQFFRRHPKKRFNPKQVAQKLKVANNKDSIYYAMVRLSEDDQLVALEDYKFKLRRQSFNGSKKSIHEGRVDMTRTGAGYIVCEDLEDDVHVSARWMNTALHGDRVQIKVWIPRGRKRPEGEVMKVLERARESFIGTIWYNAEYAIVTPDGNIPLDIVVDFDATKGAADGDKVVVAIKQWSDKKSPNPIGEVTTVLGAAGSSDIEMKAILINNGFDLEFPKEVLAEAAALPSEIPVEEIGNRRDMRDITTFTIDPDTAKDFDDALSIRYLENGHCEVGVHIADVTYYVKEGSALDKEALERSTSVYLVDRVLPMLPEKLSNELCSLRPDEDSLTFSAIFTFDKNKRVVERWYGKTIIHSDQRFTYQEAQDLLTGENGTYAAELRQLNRLASKLRKDRFKKGAINFETEEVKFRLDEDGVPIEVFVKERLDAHMLIEDFMLLANREVATFIEKKGASEEIPFVYRVHDEPNPDKVAELAAFARELGVEMNVSTPKEIALSYNRLTEMAQNEPGLKLLEPIAIRTMAKAEYTTNNIGHYGLAFDNYAHFTSPIRRYADVLVHRLLSKNLVERGFFRTNKTSLEEKCEHISKQERRAMDAERESIKYKQVEFMENHLGETFDGFISGIGDRGLYIEVKGIRAEGMVSFDLMNEAFEIGEGRLKVKGMRTGKVLKMGDAVQVKILRTDLSRRQIDMEMVQADL